jgi:hypothetical protein
MFNLILKLNPNQSAKRSLSKIEQVLKKYTPEVPFDYKFVDEEFGTSSQQKSA